MDLSVSGIRKRYSAELKYPDYFNSTVGITIIS
jgi:hypothetical protein